MFQIKKTEYFFKWYKRLKDVGAQKKIAFRILQTEQGKGQGIASITRRKMRSLYFYWQAVINQHNKRILKRRRS